MLVNKAQKQVGTSTFKEVKDRIDFDNEQHSDAIKINKLILRCWNGVPEEIVEDTYRGLDGCSCGCGGDYSGENKNKRNRAINQINKAIESSDDKVIVGLNFIQLELGNERVVTLMIDTSKI